MTSAVYTQASTETHIYTHTHICTHPNINIGTHALLTLHRGAISYCVEELRVI